MAMINIDTDFKPFGALGGQFAGRNAGLADLFNEQQLQQQSLDTVLKGTKTDREYSDFSNPQFEALRQQGIMGENQSKIAKGRMDTETLESGILSKNAENREKASQADIDGTINQLDMALAAGRANGPMGLTAALQAMPKLREVLSEAPPGQELATLELLSNRLKERRADTPKRRSDEFLKRVESEETAIRDWLKGKDELERARVSAGATVRAAEIGAQKAQDTALIQLHSQTMAQISAFEREQQDYAKLIQEASSDPMFAMSASKEARSQKDYPTKGSVSEKKEYEQKYVQKKIESSEVFKKYTGLEKNIQFLRAQADRIAAGKLPQTQQTMQQPGQSTEYTKPKVWNSTTKKWE